MNHHPLQFARVRRWALPGALLAVALLGLGGCVVLPFGDGSHGGGRDRERGDHGERDGEHRRDLGADPHSHPGLGSAADARGQMLGGDAQFRPAIFVRILPGTRVAPVWL